MPDRRHVRRVVDGEQDLVGRHGRVDDFDVRPVEQAEGGTQAGGQVKAQGVHGVVVTEVVPRETLVPNHVRLCWHNGTLPARRPRG